MIWAISIIIAVIAIYLAHPLRRLNMILTLKDPDSQVVHASFGKYDYFYANCAEAKEVVKQIIPQLNEQKVWYRRTWLRGLKVRDEDVSKAIYEAFSHGGGLFIHNIMTKGPLNGITFIDT